VRDVAMRMGLLIAGLAVGLAMVEGVLRLAAVAAPRVLERAKRHRADGRIRVACVGDSHVYGAFVPAPAAFPEELDRILRRHGVPVDAYNYGVPGQNSWQVRARLPRILERVRPQVVIVLVGHNNYWNLSERRIEAPAGAARWSWRDLRLARLLHVLRVYLQDGRAAARRPELRLVEQTELGEHLMLDLGDGMERVDMWRGGHELSPDEVERVTYEDLRAIVDLVRHAGAVPVVLGYPVVLRPEREAVRRALTRVAADVDVLCLDTAALTRGLQARHLEGLFFPDLHPTARYYRAMAWKLGRELVRRRITPRATGARPTPLEPTTGCAPLGG
jgi:lysophospholipase L1-like esterase